MRAQIRLTGEHTILRSIALVPSRGKITTAGWRGAGWSTVEPDRRTELERPRIEKRGTNALNWKKRTRISKRRALKL